MGASASTSDNAPPADLAPIADSELDSIYSILSPTTRQRLDEVRWRRECQTSQISRATVREQRAFVVVDEFERFVERQSLSGSGESAELSLELEPPSASFPTGNRDYIIPVELRCGDTTTACELLLSTQDIWGAELSVEQQVRLGAPFLLLDALRLSIYRNRKAIPYAEWRLDDTSCWLPESLRSKWFADAHYYVAYQMASAQRFLATESRQLDNFLDDRRWHERSQLSRFVLFDADRETFRLLTGGADERVVELSVRSDSEEYAKYLLRLRQVFQWLEESARVELPRRCLAEQIVGVDGSLDEGEQQYGERLRYLVQKRCFVYRELPLDRQRAEAAESRQHGLVFRRPTMAAQPRRLRRQHVRRSDDNHNISTSADDESIVVVVASPSPRRPMRQSSPIRARVPTNTIAPITPESGDVEPTSRRLPFDCMNHSLVSIGETPTTISGRPMPDSGKRDAQLDTYDTITAV